MARLGRIALWIALTLGTAVAPALAQQAAPPTEGERLEACRAQLIDAKRQRAQYDYAAAGYEELATALQKRLDALTAELAALKKPPAEKK